MTLFYISAPFDLRFYSNDLLHTGNIYVFLSRIYNCKDVVFIISAVVCS